MQKHVQYAVAIDVSSPSGSSISSTSVNPSSQIIEAQQVYEAPSSSILIDHHGVDVVYDDDLSRITWSTSIFDLDKNIWPSCLCSFFCICIISAQIGENLLWAKNCAIFGGFLFVALFIIMFGVIVKANICFILWLFLFYVTWNIRDRVRIAHSIRGSVFADIFVSCFAIPCTMAQVARQVYNYDSRIANWNCTSDGRPRNTSNSRSIAPQNHRLVIIESNE